jgi:hypothetical protein
LARWAAAVWPLILLASGMLLLIILYPLHPFEDWKRIWNDPQQRQHTVLAAVLLVAGVAQLAAPIVPALAHIWPLALLVAGWTFLTHAQHGTGEAVEAATRAHRVLGGLLILAGGLSLLAIITAATIFGILWPLALIGAAVVLTAYREPPGAYEGDFAHH